MCCQTTTPYICREFKGSIVVGQSAGVSVTEILNHGFGAVAGVCAVQQCSDVVEKTAPFCSTHAGWGRLCSVKGCTTPEATRGLCIKHGAKGKCTHLACTANALSVKVGLCGQHGGKKHCCVEDCTNFVVARGFCWSHDTGKPPVLDCSVEGCTTKSVKGHSSRGLCIKHGAKGKCTHLACTANALSVKVGLCGKHGRRKPCCVEDCNNLALTVGRGLCRSHDVGEPPVLHAVAKAPKEEPRKKARLANADGAVVTCSAPDCPSKAQARGLCKKHGAYGFCSTVDCDAGAEAHGVCGKHGARGFCSFGNCKTAAVSKGRCWGHGGGSTKVCKVKDCDTLAIARGLCNKHGARGTCTTKGCTTNARQLTKHCFKHGGGKKEPCSVAGCITTSRVKGLCYRHGGGPG